MFYHLPNDEILRVYEDLVASRPERRSPTILDRAIDKFISKTIQPAGNNIVVRKAYNKGVRVLRLEMKEAYRFHRDIYKEEANVAFLRWIFQERTFVNPLN